MVHLTDGPGIPNWSESGALAAAQCPENGQTLSSLESIMVGATLLGQLAGGALG